MSKISTNLLFENSFKENWELPALTDYKGKTLFYKDVATYIARMHILFEEHKIKRGDKIAICGRNQSNWGIVFLAAFTYGAVVVPILHEFKPDNIQYVVNHSESKILFCSNFIWDNLNENSMPNLTTIFALSDFSILHIKNEKLEHIHSQANEIFKKRYKKGYSQKEVAYFRDKPDNMCILNYTSGTTGLSKGVMISYRNIWSNIMFAIEVLPQFKKTDGVLVSMLPMAHMYGLMFEFCFEMAVGAHVYFLTRIPAPKIIMEAFETIKPTLIISVPLIIEKIYKKQIQPLLDKITVKALLKLPIIDRVLLNKISDRLNNVFGGRFLEIIVGGAAFSKEAEKFFKRIGFRYTVGYGMTETAPIITYAWWSKTVLYSVGKAVARMRIKIDSPDPINTAGEILVKGDNICLGYYKNKEATKALFTKDGWLRTGDIGVFDINGFLYIRGRCKNLILGPSGQNIYPEAIEDIINNKQYVAESIVIEQKDGKLVALVYPDYDAAKIDNVTEKDIPKILDNMLIELNAELPKYSQLDSIQIWNEEFEKTPKRSIKRFLYQKTEQ
jgi:long-chain acyl-CoA synthetase